MLTKSNQKISLEIWQYNATSIGIGVIIEENSI